MKENDNHIIQRFFEFELNAEELALFEKRMEGDAAFFKKVQRYRSVEDQVDFQFSPSEMKEKEKLIGQWNVMQREDVMDEDEIEEKIVPKTARFRWLKVAGMAAAFLLLVGALLWLFRTPDTPENLAMQYWKATEKEQFAYERSGTDNPSVDTILMAADQAFHKGQYEASLGLLNGISENIDSSETILLLKGQCYFELGNMDAAIQNFQAVLDAENVGGQDLALWFQALAFLRKGEVEKAKQKLEKIVQERYQIAREARVLLEAL